MSTCLAHSFTRPRRALRVAIAVGLVVLLVPFASRAASTDRVEFDLPAAEASTSLKRLAQQTGVEILFSHEMTANIRTRAVQGSFTVLEAAQHMLAGTGLTAEQESRSGALTITRAISA